jgi:hypothetical protein
VRDWSLSSTTKLLPRSRVFQYTKIRPGAEKGLLALDVLGILAAEVAVFGERELFLDLLFIALAVVRDPIADRALHLRHGVLDLSHRIGWI